MNDKRLINIEGFEGLYYIYENGDCYSLRANRFLKPNINNFGYVQYFLTPHNKDTHKGRWYKTHRLVLSTFKGFSNNPDRKEVNHIDHNKNNNHVSNLEWVTHSENVLKAYQGGYRKAYCENKTKKPHSLEARIKMSNAKYKPVRCYDKKTKEVTTYNSIQALLEKLGISRRTFNRILKMKEGNKNYLFGFISDVS